MVPYFFKRDVVASKIGMSGAQLSRKLNHKCGQEISVRDRKKLDEFYRTVIQDLEDRCAVLNGS